MAPARNELHSDGLQWYDNGVQFRCDVGALRVPTRAAPRLQQPVSELMSGPVGIAPAPWIPTGPLAARKGLTIAGHWQALLPPSQEMQAAEEQAGHRQEISMEW